MILSNTAEDTLLWCKLRTQTDFESSRRHEGTLKVKITHYCPGTPSKQFNTDTKLRHTQSYVQEAHKSGYKDRWYRRIKKYNE